LTAESSLTVASNDAPPAPTTPARRFFSDEQKLAIAMESAQPGATVSGVARKHGIVTGLLVPLARTVRRGAKDAREACARRCRR
jgi:transposase-like protein